MRLSTFTSLRRITMVPSPLPIYLEGEVVKGFGRGSKDLNCPTACIVMQHAVPPLALDISSSQQIGIKNCSSLHIEILDSDLLGGGDVEGKRWDCMLHDNACCRQVSSSGLPRIKAEQSNYPLDVVKSLPPDVEPGVYCGWAQVDKGPVYKMVANIGWCPFYQNKEMSVETHIIHKFDNDFYGANLKICILHYLRGEKNFKSLDDLVEAIKQDIANSKQKLDEIELQKYNKDPFFLSS